MASKKIVTASHFGKEPRKVNKMFIARTQGLNIKFADLQKVVRRAMDKAENRVGEIVEKSKEKIKGFVQEEIGDALKRHDAYKGLMGDFAGDEQGYDLQAEFGLTDQVAKAGLRMIESYLVRKDAVNVKITKTSKAWNSSTFKVSVNWIPKGVFEQMADDPRGVYESAAVPKIKKLHPDAFGDDDPSENDASAEVPWVNWMLMSPGKVVNSQYGIAYGDFPKNISRSKRAIMFSSRRAIRKNRAVNNSSFPYMVPKFLVPAADKENWVHAAITHVTVRENIADYVEILGRNMLSKYTKG